MNPASNPSINIPRSRFRQEFDHSTSFNHGDLIVLDCFTVLPGDDYSVHKAGIELIMSTPIAPIMGNIKMKVCAFFVPFRLLWEHAEEFYGANKTSAGYQTTTYKIPSRSVYQNGIGVNSLSHYLGKPYCAADSTKLSYGYASVLKERAYWFIWSEWYRAQQLQDPFIMNMSDGTPGNAQIGSISGDAKHFGSLPAKVCKQYDVFTAATISPQYGSAVELPLGSYAPLMVGSGYSVKNAAGNISAVALGNSNTTYTAGGQYQLAFKGTGFYANTLETTAVASSGGAGDYADVNLINLYADLSKATAAKINDIRYAFQLQKYLERANFGSRFFEVLAVHYGTTSPDSRLQRPEYLGGKTAPVVVRTVLSTAGYAAGTSTNVGQPGASSMNYIDISGLFSKGFVEPGFVFVLGSTTHERLYSQGLLREDTLFDRFEIYSPEFANLGDQMIKNKEVMLTGDATDEQGFGFQGHWDENRYRKKIVSGILDPNVPNSLDFWTLSEKFTTRPSLSASFIEENRDCISRCLVTGAGGPDYIADVFIEYAATRELPLYNIPGLVDHFGAL